MHTKGDTLGVIYSNCDSYPDHLAVSDRGSILLRTTMKGGRKPAVRPVQVGRCSVSVSLRAAV